MLIHHSGREPCWTANIPENRASSEQLGSVPPSPCCSPQPQTCFTPIHPIHPILPHTKNCQNPTIVFQFRGADRQPENLGVFRGGAADRVSAAPRQSCVCVGRRGDSAHIQVQETETCCALVGALCVTSQIAQIC